MLDVAASERHAEPAEIQLAPWRSSTDSLRRSSTNWRRTGGGHPRDEGRDVIEIDMLGTVGRTSPPTAGLRARDELVAAALAPHGLVDAVGFCGRRAALRLMVGPCRFGRVVCSASATPCSRRRTRPRR